MSKKEFVIIVILYVLAAIVINLSYSEIIENIAFVIPTLLTGIAGFQCVMMKELEKNEKIYAIILIALFIGFLFLIAPYNDIPAATYVYNHIGTVIIIGIILIGLVFYVDSERTKSYKKGAFETHAKLNKEIDELKRSLSIEERNTNEAYYNSVKYTTFYLYKYYIYAREVDHEVLSDMIHNDINEAINKNGTIRNQVLALKKDCDEKYKRFN